MDERTLRSTAESRSFNVECCAPGTKDILPSHSSDLPMHVRSLFWSNTLKRVVSRFERSYYSGRLLWGCRPSRDRSPKRISQRPNSQLRSRKEYCSVRGPSDYVHLKRFPVQTVTPTRTYKNTALESCATGGGQE